MDHSACFSLSSYDEPELLEREESVASLVHGTLRETELQFLARRAMEESRLARHASSPAAAAAHAYLSAAYSAQIAREAAREAEFEELALQIP